MLIFMQSTRYSCKILVQLGFPRQIFEKHSNIKFHENPSSGGPIMIMINNQQHNHRKEIYLHILQFLK